MAIPELDDLRIARERLAQLNARVENIVTDPGKSRRVKDMELAGVRGMVEQIESEIRHHRLSAIRKQVDALRDELGKTDIESVNRVVGGTLDLVEQLAGAGKDG